MPVAVRVFDGVCAPANNLIPCTLPPARFIPRFLIVELSTLVLDLMHFMKEAHYDGPARKVSSQSSAVATAHAPALTLCTCGGLCVCVCALCALVCVHSCVRHNRDSPPQALTALFVLSFFATRIAWMPVGLLDAAINHTDKWNALGPVRWLFIPVQSLQFYWFFKIVAMIRRMAAA